MDEIYLKYTLLLYVDNNNGSVKSLRGGDTKNVSTVSNAGDEKKYIVFILELKKNGQNFRN